MGAGQIAGDDERRIQRNEQGGRAFGLRPSDLVEGYVGLALKSSFGIPRRTTMAPQNQALPVQLAPLLNSGNGSIGQSFHSRSRA